MRLHLRKHDLGVHLGKFFFLLRQMPIEGYFDNFDKMSEATINASLREMGLLDPFPKQLGRFFTDLLKGDLGTSVKYRKGAAVASIIGEKCGISIAVGLSSMLFALLLGLPLGGKMARSKIWDKCGTVFIVFVEAVPAAVYYIFIQMYGTDLLGISMLFDKTKPITWILPVFSMALGNISYYAMWLRRYMVDELNKDYVKLARAKGVSSKKGSAVSGQSKASTPPLSSSVSSVSHPAGALRKICRCTCGSRRGTSGRPPPAAPKICPGRSSI